MDKKKFDYNYIGRKLTTTQVFVKETVSSPESDVIHILTVNNYIISFNKESLINALAKEEKHWKSAKKFGKGSVFKK